MRKILILLILFSGFQFLLIDCNNKDNPPILQETKRLTSPDKKVDAVILRSDQALSATAYYIFIDSVGFITKNKDLKYSQFTCDHQDSLDISWIENKLLNIKFKQARIFNYSNFWHSKDINNWKYVVEIKLNSDDNKTYLSGRDKYEE